MVKTMTRLNLVPNYRIIWVVRQEIQVNKTRLTLEIEKIDVLTKHYNSKIVELLKNEQEQVDKIEEKK